MLDKIVLTVGLLMVLTVGIGTAFADESVTQTTGVTVGVASVVGMTVSPTLVFSGVLPGTTAGPEIVGVTSQCNDRLLQVYVRGDNFAGPTGVASYLVPALSNLQISGSSITTTDQLAGTHTRMLGVNYPFTMTVPSGTPGGAYTTTLTWTGIPDGPSLT